MTFLDYSKQYHNFDIFLVLLDDAGYSDEEITSKFQVSKQRIYDARKRLDPIFKALEQVDPYKRDMRNPDVQSIIEAFSEAFGTTKSSQYDRYSAKRLHSKLGAESIIKVIKALAAHGGDKYAPTINNVSQLEDKWVQVGKFLRTKSEQGVIEL